MVKASVTVMTEKNLLNAREAIFIYIF